MISNQPSEKDILTLKLKRSSLNLLKIIRNSYSEAGLLRPHFFYLLLIRKELFVRELLFCFWADKLNLYELIIC